MRKMLMTAVIGATFLLGCSTSPEERSPEPSSSSYTLIDQAYLRTLRKEITGVKDMNDAKLIRIGKDACTSAHNGNTFFQTVDVIEQAGLTESDASYLVGAAFVAYCPHEFDKPDAGE